MLWWDDKPEAKTSAMKQTYVCVCVREREREREREITGFYNCASWRDPVSESQLRYRLYNTSKYYLILQSSHDAFPSLA